MGAALKNVIAVGAGALHGLGYGDNAKAALMTRGLRDQSSWSCFWSRSADFYWTEWGRSLIVTCTSIHSRNWRCGDQIGKGVPLPTILENMGMVVEG